MGANFLRQGWNQDVDVMTPQLLAWQAWYWGFENRYVPQQKFQGHSGKCVYPGVVCLIRLFFFRNFFKIYRTFLQTVTFLCVFLTKHFQFLTWSHPLIFFKYKILSSSHLQIFSPSDPHTFSFAKTHMPKSPNLDICSAKFSNILTSSSSIFFFILQTSRPLNLRSSQFHTLSSAASRQKNTPTGTTFSSVAFGQKQNHRSRKPCPNRFKRHAVSREKEKPLPAKNRPAGQRTFFPMRGKISPSGINDEAPKGRGKRWPSAAFWSQKQTHRKRNKCPTGNPFHPILIYYPFSFSSSNIGKKKNLTYKNQNFCFKTFTFSALLTHTSARPGIFTDSLNIFKFLILRFFWSSRLLSHTKKKKLFYVFKFLLNLNYSFFSANAGNKKESEGVVSLVRH